MIELSKNLRRHYFEFEKHDDECVGWAESHLLDYPDSMSLLSLASLVRPYDSDYIASIFTSAVDEMGIEKPDPLEELFSYVSEKLRSIVELGRGGLGTLESNMALFDISQHYLDFNKPKQLEGIYEFSRAYDCLTTIGRQNFLPHLTEENSHSEFVKCVELWFEGVSAEK